MNEEITYQVLQEAINYGVREFVICVGSRNSSFVDALRIDERLTTYYWPEERSAAFFAMGRSRLTHQPTGIITTSGTAVAELFPAVMESYYTNVPILLITADRPRRFRGSGAPQSAEQEKLFGLYTHFQDLAKDILCDLSKWNQRGPAHINVCLEEPQSEPSFIGRVMKVEDPTPSSLRGYNFDKMVALLNQFWDQIERPLVVVSSIEPNAQESVACFLLALNVPVIFEGSSGLREDSRLQALRIRRTDKILEIAEAFDYPIDGVFRIGGIPTPRLWRDLEYLKDKVKVCSLSEYPFSGLSWNRNLACVPIDDFLRRYKVSREYNSAAAQHWLDDEIAFEEKLNSLFKEEPQAEASLVNALSNIIPEKSHVYLGNSLPIREWNLAAVNEHKNFKITVSRGQSGIDGQISTFFGLSEPSKENWALLGDLTTLYDMMGWWITPQIEDITSTIVVINNGGGMIFSQMYPNKKEMLNEHSLNFEPLAKMWGLTYASYKEIPSTIVQGKHRLIEVIPCPKATSRFLKKMIQLNKRQEIEFRENVFK